MKIEPIQIILLVVLVFVIFGLQGQTPTFSVQDVQDQQCAVDEDCPCWGTINQTGITARGIGVANCVAGKCDVTWCADLEPVGVWIKENPWHWVKENIVIAMAALALLALIIFFPKR